MSLIRLRVKIISVKTTTGKPTDTVLRGCIKFTNSNLDEKKIFRDSKVKTILSLENMKNTDEVLKLLTLTESIYLFPQYINNTHGYSEESLYGTLEGIIEFLKKHKIKSIKAAYFPPTIKASFYLEGTFGFGYLLNRNAIQIDHSKEQIEYFKRILDYNKQEHTYGKSNVAKIEY